MRVTILLVAALASCAAPPSSYRHHPELAPLHSLSTYGTGNSTNPANDPAPGWKADIHAIIGGRHMQDGRTWDRPGANLEDHFSSGIEFNARPSNVPIGVEFGVMSSFDYEREEVGFSDFDVFGSVSEVYFGPRVTVDVGDFHPYVGAGITFMSARIDFDGLPAAGGLQDDDDTTAGGYVHGGFVASLGPFNLGIDIRHTFETDVTLFGIEGESDYTQVGLVFGGNF